MDSQRDSFPIGQRWFIKRFKEIFPDVTLEGYCFGLSNMVMQAIIADELHVFEQRLKDIKSIKTEVFKETLDKVKQKRIDIIKEVKEKIGDKKLTPEEKELISQDENVDDFLIDLKAKIHARKSTLTKSERKAEFKKQRDSHLLNIYVQKEIEKELSHRLTPKEHRLLEVSVFLEGMELYQNAQNHPEIFNIPAGELLQDEKKVLPLTLPKKLENIGISQISKTTSLFTSVEDFKNYLDSFRETIREADLPSSFNPIVFTLHSLNHSITVSYDFKEDKWLLIDANQLPTKVFNNTNEAADKILSAFYLEAQPRPAMIIIDSIFYCKSNNEKKLKRTFSHWHNTAAWKATHKISEEKASFVDKKENSWLRRLICYKSLNREDKKTIKKLLTHGADPNLITNVSLLILAINAHNKTAVHLLLKYGANPNQETRRGHTPLIAALAKGDIYSVKKLLKHGANPKMLNSRGETALDYIDEENEELKRVINDACKNRNAQGDTSLLIALRIALRNKDEKKVKEILREKKLINQANYIGETPLLVAIKNNASSNTISKLIAAGANPHQSDHEGKSPLHVAIIYGNLPAINSLINCGADINQLDGKGYTPLHNAISYFNAKAITRLLEEGADPNWQDKRAQSTSLHLAVLKEDPEVPVIIEELLKHGVNPFLRNRKRDTALDIAFRDGEIKMMELLLDKMFKNGNHNKELELFVEKTVILTQRDPIKYQDKAAILKKFLSQLPRPNEIKKLQQQKQTDPRLFATKQKSSHTPVGEGRKLKKST